jgi:hypothetical protein
MPHFSITRDDPWLSARWIARGVSASVCANRSAMAARVAAVA